MSSTRGLPCACVQVDEANVPGNPEHGLPTVMGVLLVSDAEICRQLRFHGILAQDRLAESMHGGDLRQIHPRHLPLQMAVIRLLRQLLRDSRGNFAAQL